MNEFEQLQAQHRALVASQQSSANLRNLSDLLSSHFTIEELAVVCFDLGVDFDTLAGNTRQTKAVELIRWAERRGMLDGLLLRLQEARPMVDWPVPSGVPIVAIEAYIDEARRKSERIASPEERGQLQANLRYWSRYIYEQTGQYPEIDLLPVSPDYKESDRHPVHLIAAVVLLFGMFLLGAGFSFYFGLDSSDAPAHESVILTETAVVQAEQTRSAQTGVDIQLTEMATMVAAVTATAEAIINSTLEAKPSMTPTSTVTPRETLTETRVPTLPETPTPDFSAISVRLLEPQNGAQVEPLITVRGDYTNLRAGWSIHVLLQPISQGGKLFPAQDYYLVPSSQPSGTWEIEVQLGSGTDLQTPERYILEAIISTSDAGRAYLEEVSEAGIDQLPSEFLTFPQLTTINRAAYDEIDETRIVYYGLNATGDSYEIYSMRTDGTDVRQLTNTANVSETAPSLSPDGDKLAFIQIVPGDRWVYSLWIMDSSGKNRTLLADNIRTEISPVPVPVWSPNGNYIAYNSQVQNSAGIWEYQIMLYDLTNNNITQLTESVNGATYPSWVPDSQTLIYRERFGIYSIDVTTRERVPVFNDPVANETILSVSPDGTKIAMTYFIDTPTTIGNRDIYVLEMGTDNLQRMTTHGGLDWLPSWHPNGVTIYFESHRETGRAGIWAIEADGTNERRISAQENLAGSPFVGWMRAYLPREP